MGPAAGLLPKHGQCLCYGFLSHCDWPHTGHCDLNVILDNPILEDLPHNKGPPTAGMDLERKKDRNRIMMQVPDVAHRNIKSQN